MPPGQEGGQTLLHLATGSGPQARVGAELGRPGHPEGRGAAGLCAFQPVLFFSFNPYSFRPLCESPRAFEILTPGPSFRPIKLELVGGARAGVSFHVFLGKSDVSQGGEPPAGLVSPGSVQAIGGPWGPCSMGSFG